MKGAGRRSRSASAGRRAGAESSAHRSTRSCSAMPPPTSSAADRCGTCWPRTTADRDSAAAGRPGPAADGRGAPAGPRRAAPRSWPRSIPSAGGAVGAGRARQRSPTWSRSGATNWPALIEHPVQTNEPGRSAALMGGFLEVARRDRVAAAPARGRRERGAQPALGPLLLCGARRVVGRPGRAGAVRPCVRRGCAAAARERAGRRAPRLRPRSARRDRPTTTSSR